jgi:hypothetical protein
VVRVEVVGLSWVGTTRASGRELDKLRGRLN